MIERRFGILWRRLEVRLDTIPLVLMAIFHIHNLSMDDVVPLPPNIDPNEVHRMCAVRVRRACERRVTRENRRR